MSLSNYRIFGTVKFKIAMWYAALFAVSAGLGFIIFYYLFNLNMLRSSDATLRSNAAEISFEYLTGNRFRRFDKEIPISSISPEILAAFQKKIPGLQPVFAFERDAYGRPLQTVVGHANRRLYELRFESDGSIYNRMLNIADHLTVVQRTFNQKVYGTGSSNIFFRLYRPDGKLLIESETADDVKLENTPFSTEQDIESYIISDKHFRVLTTPMFDGNILEIGRTLEPMLERLNQYSRMFIIAICTVLVLGAFCGWLIARKFMTGVERVSEAAMDIAGGDFSRRVEHGNEGEEIDRLVVTFNRMNDNTEKLLTELRMVTDNIAHDLRTPLTRLRGMVEVSLNAPLDQDSYYEIAGAVSDECSNMLLMLNTMLEITRTGSRPDELRKTELSLNDILQQGFDLIHPLAELKDIEMQISLPPSPLMLTVDKLKIQRMTANLLENAIKFTPAGGTIRLSLETDQAGNAVIKVTDTGCGINAEDQKHIFERFFRSDQSRTLPGNGLGLALVQAIVLAHQGTISVSSELGQGATFMVILPSASP
jgi:signal transduction histidine kinase